MEREGSSLWIMVSMRRGKTNMGGEENRTPGMGLGKGYEHLGPQLWGGASS
jgi:hypothetical protein